MSEPQATLLLSLLGKKSNKLQRHTKSHVVLSTAYEVKSLHNEFLFCASFTYTKKVREGYFLMLET